MNQLQRLSAATRVFGLAAVAGLGLLVPNYQLLLPILALAALATTVAYLSATSALPTGLLTTAEATLSGLIIGTSLPEGVPLLPYLAALCLVAGLVGGPWAVVAALASEIATVALALLVWPGSGGTEVLLTNLAPWILAGVGLGLLGTWLRSVGNLHQPAVESSYRAAYRLVSQLRTVARRLSRGLDSTLIAHEVSSIVARETGAKQAAVFVRSETGSLAPLVYHGGEAAELPNPDRLDLADVWIEQQPVTLAHGGESLLGLPLCAGSRVVGVVVARVTELPPPSVLGALSSQLDESALRLDTALIFDEIRSVATSEERHRLAREIHDGIAQEIAGLGYAVDSLISSGGSAEQQSTLVPLRDELTRILTELRLSIFGLRSDVVSGRGLGQALADYIRQVGSQSSMTVHLTLAEATARLRPEVEAELLRIVQEAVTNARKHSRATNIWVDCRVDAPAVQIEIRDDGYGLGTSRPDSYGLRIMQERADRLGARLEIRSASSGQARGTVVRVAIPPSLRAGEPRDNGERSGTAV